VKLLLIAAARNAEAKGDVKVFSGLAIPLLELETLQGLDVVTSENKIFLAPVFLVGRLARTASF